MYLCVHGDLISTPERLIAGIGAGLSLGIDAGDCACCVGGGGLRADFFRDAGLWFWYLRLTV